MCSPTAVAGAAISAGGTYLQGQAANKAASANQAAANRATALSAAEFDRRLALAQQGDKRVGDLLEKGFQERYDLEGNTNRDLTRAEVEQIVRDSGSSDEYYNQLGNALAEQAGGYDSARHNYNTTVEAERAKQAGFRGQADTTVNNLISGSGTAALETDRAAALKGRKSLTDYAKRGKVTPSLIYKDGPSVIADAIASLTGTAEQKAARDTAGQAAIASYGDAAVAGNRRIANTGDTLNNIDLNSRASSAALPYALAPAQMKYANTTQRATQARETAGNNLQGNLRLSNNQLNLQTVPLKQYADKIDAALADYYRSRLTSESDYATGTIGASQRYEDANTALTNYKIANTRGVSQLGDLMAGFGGTVAASGGGPSWSDLGDKASQAGNKISSWF